MMITILAIDLLLSISTLPSFNQIPFAATIAPRQAKIRQACPIRKYHSISYRNGKFVVVFQVSPSNEFILFYFFRSCSSIQYHKRGTIKVNTIVRSSVLRKESVCGCVGVWVCGMGKDNSISSGNLQKVLWYRIYACNGPQLVIRLQTALRCFIVPFKLLNRLRQPHHTGFHSACTAYHSSKQLWHPYLNLVTY